MTSRKDDRSMWAIGGSTIIGVGIGLIFVHSSPILMTASILIGVGFGLIITSCISIKNKS
ncbi:hypothetical protein ABN763_00900 [Spongiivirga sp. MCCC 1A20706]|uniref:hypothetical protein n=1 Tax=Spongiivirga sp. MCCC 1A20706 TaxID=3160963 RepID=UPI003977433E